PPPRSTQVVSAAGSDVNKSQVLGVLVLNILYLIIKSKLKKKKEATADNDNSEEKDTEMTQDENNKIDIIENNENDDLEEKSAENRGINQKIDFNNIDRSTKNNEEENKTQ
ncbi:MAG: hypothetical protein K2P12_01780, partial [Clostridia bacterium]|nr:hypothetical protein [Clostridia bacterium]